MAFWTLIAKLGIDTTSFQSGMKRAESLAVATGTKMRSALNSTAANYLGAAAVAALTKRTIDYGSVISDVADRLAVSTDALQEFYYAAEQTGGSVESVNLFLEKLAENKRLALITPNGMQADAFKQLGISINELRDGRVEDLAKKIGKVFETGDPQKLIGALKAVGGRSSGSMVVALVSGLERAGEEARRLGLILSNDTVQKLDAVGDKATEIGKRVVASVAEPLAWIFDKINSGLDYAQRTLDVMAGWYTAFSEKVPDKNQFVKEFINEQYKTRELAKKTAEEAKTRNQAARNLAVMETDETESKAVKTTKAKQAMADASDPLAKIGGLFLGADQSLRAVNEKQLTELKRANVALSKIAASLISLP